MLLLSRNCDARFVKKKLMTNLSLRLPLGTFLCDRLNSAAATQLMLYVVAALLLAISLRRATSRGNIEIPLANPPKWYQLGIAKRLQFFSNSLDDLSAARKTSKGKPFRLLTNVGEGIVLPPHYAEVIQNERCLSFGQCLDNVSEPALCRGIHYIKSA